MKGPCAASINGGECGSISGSIGRERWHCDRVRMVKERGDVVTQPPRERENQKRNETLAVASLHYANDISNRKLINNN